MNSHARIVFPALLQTAAVPAVAILTTVFAGCAGVRSEAPGNIRQVSGTVAIASANELDYRPLDPAKDPAIDLFFGDWRESIPFNTQGALTERAILSPLAGGDVLHPSRRGSVLTYLKRLSRATIEPWNATSPTTLAGEQEIIGVLAGEGEIAAGGNTERLRPGVYVLIPAGLEFIIRNTGPDQLEMILAAEPAPDGFRPNAALVVRDARALPWRDPGIIQGHWAHNGKNLFRTADGLGTLESVVEFTFDPMTIGQPHSINPGTEVVMVALEGDFLVLLGKELRWLKPSQAYLVPPTGFTAFANQNPSDEPIRMLFIARFTDHEVRP